MKRSMWVPLALGIVATYIVLDRRARRYSDSYDDLQIAANKAEDWGSQQRLTGIGRNLVGRIKEGFGRFNRDPDLVDRGIGDQVKGAVQDTAGKAAHLASDAIRDLSH